MHDFKNLGGPTKFASAIVGVYLICNLLSAVTSFLAQPRGPDEVGLPELLAIAEVVALLICMVTVGRWIYVASSNAHQLRDDLSISPGWAVGWYFVPIMNLFKPLQAMKEIWSASDELDGYDRQGTPAIIGWWWGLWIASNILGNISFRMSMANADPQMIASIELLTAAINAPLCLSLITLMRKIADAQESQLSAAAFA